MSSYRNRLWEESLLPFEVIEAVVNGDSSACEEVLRNFYNYMEAVCTISVMNEKGCSKKRLDQNMKQAVEQKLLYAITNKFEMLPLE